MKTDRRLYARNLRNFISQLLKLCGRLQNSRFRKAGSAVSVILECEAREPHTPAGRVRRECVLYGPSLAFAKNTAVCSLVVWITAMTNRVLISFSAV